MAKAELRKDYILDRWVVISEKRGKRTHQYKKPKLIETVCPFCPGHEDMTEKEVFRIDENGKWKMRIFLNKFPAFGKGNPKIKNKGIYTYGDAFGDHEVIVETRYHTKQLADLDVFDIKEIFDVYGLRIDEISKRKGIKYVQVIKNRGALAGTSILHSHSQVFGYNKVPFWIQKKIEANKNKCQYCNIIKKEIKSERAVYDGKHFSAFCPFASRSPYELWFFPKRHVKKISELNNEEMLDLSKILKKCLLKLNKENFSYNYYLCYSPNKDNLHFHIELLPRLDIWGGFELATNTMINGVSPEKAAKFYRGNKVIKKL